MIFSSNLNWLVALLGSVLLSTCFQGLFNLAKYFLTPFHRSESSFFVDSIIAETNAKSLRWMNSLSVMPITTGNIEDGHLDDHVLPKDGVSIREADKAEAQRDKARRQVAVQSPPSPREAKGLSKSSTLKAATSVATTAEKMAELARLKESESELAETMAILKAPLGFDVVPDSVDAGHLLKSNSPNLGKPDKSDSDLLANQFRKTVGRELKTVKGLLSGNGSPPFS